MAIPKKTIGIMGLIFLVSLFILEPLAWSVWKYFNPDPPCDIFCQAGNGLMSIPILGSIFSFFNGLLGFIGDPGGGLFIWAIASLLVFGIMFVFLGVATPVVLIVSLVVGAIIGSVIMAHWVAIIMAIGAGFYLLTQGEI